MFTRSTRAVLVAARKEYSSHGESVSERRVWSPASAGRSGRDVQLAPEEGLQGVEVEVGLIEESHLVVAGAHVLLVHAVHDEYACGGELKAAFFEA